MPYRIGRRGQQWCVLTEDDNPVDGGCHDSRADALAHQRALQVNVEDAGARTGAISDAFALDPPESWFFEIPAWFAPNMKASVVTEGPEAGRFAATVAPRGVCILSGRGECWQPTDSPTGYEDAHQGDTVTAEGSTIKTANLAAGVPHVDGTADYSRAVDVMAHTGTALARVRFIDMPGYGTVALGAAWPGLTDQQVRLMQASALSGDWRYRAELGHYDMAGAIFVNNPGLPIPQRPVFSPLTLAASAGSPPPVVGAWLTSEEPPMLTCSSCGAALHVVPPGIPVAAAASVSAQGNTLATAVAPCACQGHTAAPEDAPAEGEPTYVTQEQLAEVVTRLDALEAFLTEEVMAEADNMAASAALPEVASAEG